MRLPLQSKSKAQRRQLLRQLIWSLCLVAPGSLSFADDNAEKKNEPKATPAISLPTFPTSLPSPPTVSSPATVASPANTPSSTTTKPQSKEVSAPPALLPPLPPSVAAPPTSSNASATAPAPNAGRKDAVIISMPNPIPVPAASSVGAKALPAATSTAGGTSGVAGTTAAPATKAPEQVSIKFGDMPEGNKNSSSSVSGRRPSAAAAPSVDEPASFRLSDKASTTNATPAPLNSTLPQNAKPTLQAPTPAAPTLAAPAPAAPTLRVPESPKPLKPEAIEATTAKSNPAPSVTKPVDSKLVDSKPVETKSVDLKLVETKPSETRPSETKPGPGTTSSQPQPLGSLTISKQGIAPSVPEKIEGRREAVLIRPKAIVLAQEPTSIAAKANQEQATSAPVLSATPLPSSISQPNSVPVPTAKPSTMPQALANNASTANAAPMKKADSKVSPLPPSQLPAAEKIAIQAVVPPVLALDPKPQANATLEVAKPTADIAALPSLPTVTPPSVVVAKPSPSLTLSQDTEPPVVSGAEVVEATLTSAKKYSKPADRTIQVGTVALTTMRVGEQDVLKCEVDDTSVCRAIVTADGEVALLPGKVGVTRATFWIKEANGQSKVETADIKVGEVLPIANADSVEIGRLNDSLQRLYPSTNLRVIASDRCLEICGEADSEQQAREVLQLVRKLCLVPVKDKVTVR